MQNAKKTSKSVKKYEKKCKKTVLPVERCLHVFFSQKIKKAENHHKMKRTVANRFKKCMKNAGKTLILQKCLKKQKLIGAENEVYC